MSSAVMPSFKSDCIKHDVLGCRHLCSAALIQA